MHIDLSRVANTKGHPPKSAYWNRKERSSADYHAMKLQDGRYLLYRMPADGAEYVQLGCCDSEDVAERRLDWWVQNDHRVRLQVERAVRWDMELNLLPLILESAGVK